MSFTSAQSESMTQALIQHPSSSIRKVGAALPPAALDPNPRLTLALYDVWTAIRPFLSLARRTPEFIRPQDIPEFSPGQAFMQALPFLVSYFIYFIFLITRD
jgi:hypothetical protein